MRAEFSPAPLEVSDADAWDAGSNLFTAGWVASGIAAGGYVSGASLGDGTFFGRRVGRAAGSLPT